MTVENQMRLKLPPTPIRQPQDIPLEVILRQPNRIAALKLCVQASGLTDDQVCLELEIDNAQWSRIMRGTGHFPTNRYEELYQICGNHIPLTWDIYKRGFDPSSLRPLRSEVEAKLEAEQAKNEELEKKLSYLEEFVSKARG